jgi:hypothetical protein
MLSLAFGVAVVSFFVSIAKERMYIKNRALREEVAG